MKLTTKSLLFVAATLGLAFSQGCVSDRPARNGVFNENQYLRKSFLIRPPTMGADGQPMQDPGWMLKATVTDVSSPNPLGGNMFFLVPGIHNMSDQVRFTVTSDKLNMPSAHSVPDAAPVSAAASGPALPCCKRTGRYRE